MKKNENRPNELKEVIAIYVNKTFKQFLKKSEVRLLLEVMKDHKGIVGIELAKITPSQYNSHFGMKALTSKVPGFEGLCKPVWLNNNSVLLRIDTRQTGFFRLVKKHWLFGYLKTGKKFHGYISSNMDVRTTEGIYSTSQFI